MRRPLRRGLSSLLALMLVVALTACTARAGEWGDGVYTIAGGGRNGVYDEYAGHLAEAIASERGVRMVAGETAGSVDNLLRVADGTAVLGFAQGDAAADAVAGVGAFTEPLRIEAVARLYDEYIHIVVRGDSQIDEVADLAGGRVSLGATNSGVTVIAGRLLAAAGVDAGTIEDPRLGLSDSIDALERGDIDGFFWVGGLPTPGIDELADRMPVRLLPVEQTWVGDVNADYSHAYRTADVPPGLYGLDFSTPTMAVPNYLVTSASVPPAIVEDILASLFDARSSIARRVSAAALLDRRQAIFTGPVPLHSGAVEFFRERRG